MLDMQEDFQNDVCDKLILGPMDPYILVRAMKALTPDELAELEDELDFAQFTGIQSERIRMLISTVSARSETLAA